MAGYQNYPNYQFNPQQNNMMPNMAANTPPMQQFTQQFVFPQPVGSVYNLSTAADINNIPVGSNVTVGLCLNENILQVKTLQNGVPSLLSYRLSPIEGQMVSQPENIKNDNEYTQIVERINRIENVLFAKPVENKPIEPTTGGRLDWQV